MVSRTFPATQCPRTMIFTDYAWPCCSHVHQPRHARARRPFEGYDACCENKATTAAALYSNRDFFRVYVPRKYEESRFVSDFRFRLKETRSSRIENLIDPSLYPSIDEIDNFEFILPISNSFRGLHDFFS